MSNLATRTLLAGLIVLVAVLSSDVALGQRPCGNDAACCKELNKFWKKKAYNRAASIKKEIPIRDTQSATLSIAFSCPSPHSGLVEGIKFLHDFSKSGQADIDYYEHAMSLSQEKGYTIALQPLPSSFARLLRGPKIIVLSMHNMMNRMPPPMVASIIVHEAHHIEHDSRHITCVSAQDGKPDCDPVIGFELSGDHGAYTWQVLFFRDFLMSDWNSSTSDLEEWDRHVARKYLEAILDNQINNVPATAPDGTPTRAWFGLE